MGGAGRHRWLQKNTPVDPSTTTRPGKDGKADYCCVASSYLHALLLPRAVDWCRATWTEIQVQTDARAGEMIMNVWPGASRARKRSPNPKDGRARLEAVAAWPEEPRLQRREHYDESQAVESRYYVLVGKAEELANQGELIVPPRKSPEAGRQALARRLCNPKS